MERDISQLKENFNDLHKRYVSTDEKIDRILDILQGDDFAHGMIESVKDHEVRIKKLEETNKKVGWTVGGALVAGGYGLFELVKKLLPFVAILLLFTGCITQKKREDIFHRHAREHPADVLPYCPPPTTKLVKGAPDTVTVVVTEKVPVIHAGDTVWLDCPDHEVRYILQTDTVTETDVAPFEAERLKRIGVERDLAVSEARREDAVKQSRGRLYWIIGLSVALALAVVVRVKGLFT